MKLMATAALAVLALGLSSCIWQPGPTATPDPNGPANVSTQVAFPSGGAVTCTGNLTWIYTPISLTGNEGIGTTITQPRQYNSFPGNGGQCTFGDSQYGLRQGRWQITVTPNPQSCVVPLGQGYNLVTFTQGVAGCQNPHF